MERNSKISEKYFTPKSKRNFLEFTQTKVKRLQKKHFQQVPVTTLKENNGKTLLLSKNGDSVPKLDETGKPILRPTR